MPATIRLTRLGKKHKPFYRIVVMDKRKNRDGRYVEALGFYNPLSGSNEITLDNDKLQDWQKKGAVLSEGMRKLLLKLGKKN